MMVADWQGVVRFPGGTFYKLVIIYKTMDNIPDDIKSILTEVGLYLSVSRREALEDYIRQLLTEIQKGKRLNASLRQASTR